MKATQKDLEKYLIKLKIDEAHRLTELSKLELNVSKIDGVMCFTTADINFKRVSVEVENGLITKVLGLG